MFRRFFSIMIFLFLSGCAATSTPMPSQGLILSKSACAKGSTAASDRYQAPPSKVAGGEIQSGGFLFQFWLYCNSDMTLPEYVNEQSSIDGLGIWSSWEYQGASIGGSINIAFGPVPANTPALSFDGGLTPRSSGAFHRGIEISQDDLKKYIQSNQPVRYEIRIQTEDGVFGAILSFTLQSTGDGYLPVDVIVQGLE